MCTTPCWYWRPSPSNLPLACCCLHQQCSQKKCSLSCLSCGFSISTWRFTAGLQGCRISHTYMYCTLAQRHVLQWQCMFGDYRSSLGLFMKSSKSCCSVVKQDLRALCLRYPDGRPGPVELVASVAPAWLDLAKSWWRKPVHGAW